MAKQNKGRRSATNARQIWHGLSWERWLTNPTVWILAATVGLIFMAQQYWGEGTTGTGEIDPQFALTVDRIAIAAPEDWIGHSPTALLQAEFLEPARSLLDSKLVGDLAAYLKTWPFVRSIDSIVKSPQGIKVDISYRQPIAIVEWKTSEERLRRCVDDLGQVVPIGLEKSEGNSRLLLINVVDPGGSHLQDWMSWPDTRIVDATKIAAILQNHFADLGIYRIVTFRKNQRDFSQPFELWTARGAKIIWSDDPNQDSTEMIALRLDLLTKWQQENGNFDQLAGRKKIDVRSGLLRITDDFENIAQNQLGISKAR
jgi:hypothetical protein